MQTSFADPCPIRGQCGGCPEMDRPPDAQREQKLDLLRRGLSREPDAWVPSPRQLGYRARVTLNVGPDGRPGFQSAGSHTHVPVSRCAVARDEINDALAILAAEAPDLRPLTRLELRSDGQRVVLSAEARDIPGARRLLSRLSLDSALEGRAQRGDPQLQLTVAGIAHRVSPRSFFQVNPEVNELLTTAVRDHVLAFEPAHVLDLYAGVGNLSLPLAARGVPVTLVESDASAMADARATLARLKLRAELRQMNVGKLQAGEIFFDVLVLDPPRAGAPGVLDRLLLTRPKGIVMVSCNPYTLSRDLNPAMKAGYRIIHLAGYDMFPHTPHLETLCVLARG